MIKNSLRFIILILLAGWSFDFLFWKHSVGLNYAIFMVIALGIGYYLLISNQIKPSKNTVLILVPFSIFTIVTFIRREPLTVALSFTFSMLSTLLFSVSYLGGRWPLYTLTDYLRGSLELISSMLTRTPGYIKQNRDTLSDSNFTKKKNFKPILRGLLIAIPILILFSALLASADVVFNQRLLDILDIFKFDNGLDYFIRLITIILIAYLLGGAYLHAGERSADEKIFGVERPLLKPILGTTETIIVFSSVALLFLFFVIIQFQYFFGGLENIGVEGYTYSEYARKGFSELIIVSVFSLLLVIGFRGVTILDKRWKKNVFSILSTIIVAEVMVILASSYNRLMLAIGWHSYSRLRLYPRIFIFWLSFLFLIVLILGIVDKTKYFTLAGLLTSFGFAITLLVVNVDASIVRFNINRISEGGRISVHYFASLSTDVVPALIDGFQDPELDDPTREAMGAAIFCFIETNEIISSDNLDWRSYNYSVWHARASLDEIDDNLEYYHLIERPMGDNVVVAPSGKRFPCLDR